MSKQIDIEQVRTHVFQDEKGFQLVAVVSRMINRELAIVGLNEGCDTVTLAVTTPLDCYYISIYFSGDQTCWETYDRLKAQDLQTVLDEIENNFKSRNK